MNRSGPGDTEIALTPASRVSRAEDALAADVAGDVVLLNAVTGYFHQLNDVGSYVWRRLEEPRTLAELCRSAGDDFEADADTCERDIAAFVLELHRASLVRID